MKNKDLNMMESTFNFEVEMGLRSDYTDLEKRLIDENSRQKRELSELTELMRLQKAQQSQQLVEFCHSLHKNMMLLIDESTLPESKKEWLIRKITPIQSGQFDSSVAEFFDHIQINK